MNDEPFLSPGAKALIAFVALAIAIIVTLALGGNKAMNAEREACKARGGVLVTDKNRKLICIAAKLL